MVVLFSYQRSNPGLFLFPLMLSALLVFSLLYAIPCCYGWSVKHPLCFYVFEHFIPSWLWFVGILENQKYLEVHCRMKVMMDEP